MAKKLFNSFNPSVLSQIINELSDLDNTYAKHIATNLPDLSLSYLAWQDRLIALIVVFLAVDIPFVTVKVIYQRISKRVKEIRRQKYYAAENERRRRFREERRKIHHRSTLGKCPTPKEFLKAWLESKESLAGMLKFGGMVHDLACFVDSSLVFNPSRTKIIGRNGGIKAWIRENVPELLPKYQTIMRYHVTAIKLRQFTSIKDPMPTQILDESIDQKTMRSTEEELDYAREKSISVLDEITNSLKFRYLPNRDLIEKSAEKWTKKVGFKRDSRNEAILQKAISKAIMSALKMLRESIDSHVREYLNGIRDSYNKMIKESQKISQKRRNSKSYKLAKPHEFKIRKWRECKSWLYEVLDKYEGLVGAETAKVNK
jgi:hypothetical protein